MLEEETIFTEEIQMNMHPDTLVRLTVSLQQTDAILGALSALPFSQVSDLILNIRGQATAQIMAMQPVNPTEEPTT